MSMQGCAGAAQPDEDSSVKERRWPGHHEAGQRLVYKVQIAWFWLVVIESPWSSPHRCALKSIDDGIYPKDSAVVVRLSLYVAAIAS